MATDLTPTQSTLLPASTASLSPSVALRPPPSPGTASIATDATHTVPLSPSLVGYIYDTHPSPTFSSQTHTVQESSSSRGGAIDEQPEVEEGQGSEQYEPYEPQRPQKRGEIGWRDSVHGQALGVTIPSTSATPPLVEIPSSPTPRPTVAPTRFQQLSTKIGEKLPPYSRITFFLFLSIALLAGTVAILLLVLPTLNRQSQQNNNNTSNNSQSMMSMSTIGFGYLVFGVVVIFEVAFLYSQLRANYAYWRRRYMEAKPEAGSSESSLENRGIITRGFDAAFYFNRPPRITQGGAPPPAYNRDSLLPEDSAVMRAQRTGAAPLYGSPEDSTSTVLLRGPKRVRRGNGSTRSNATRRHPAEETVVELEMEERATPPDTVVITIPPRAVIEA